MLPTGAGIFKEAMIIGTEVYHALKCPHCRQVWAKTKEHTHVSSRGTVRLTREFLDEIREFIQEEHGRISMKIVSNRFTLSRTCSRKAIRCLRLRPLVIRTVPHLQDRHIRDRRKFAEEMLARLALASGRRIWRQIATSRRLELDVICFSDEKIFRVDAAAPGRSFHTLYLGKVGRRNNATPFS